jgi:hypothetical protein
MMRSSLAAFVAAFWLAVLVLSEAQAESFGRYGIAFAPRSRNLVQHSNLLINVRGGATLSTDDDEDEDDEEEEEEEEDDDEVEDEEVDAALAASAVKASKKSKTKKAVAGKEPLAASTVKKSAKSKTRKSAAGNEGLADSTVKASAKSKTKKSAAAKEAVNVNLLRTSAHTTKTTKKKKSSILKIFHVPYIIGACLNPVTLFKMTKGFWVSLFDLDYLKQVRRKLSRGSNQPLDIESLVQHHNHGTNVLN